jgi:hypothetical protein
MAESELNFVLGIAAFDWQTRGMHDVSRLRLLRYERKI